MEKAGGIIAMVAGVFGVVAAVVTLFFGGLGGAVEAEGANTIIGLGWGGIFFSFLTIVFGAVGIVAKSKKPGILIILTSILGAFLGGTIVAICMALAFMGGIVTLIGGNQKMKLAKNSE